MKKLMALCLAMVFLLAGCSGGETAKQATENGLKAVKSMDAAAMTKYFGSDVLNESDKEAVPQDLSAVLVKNFSYEIVNVEEKDGTATAKIKLTNTDMKKVMGKVIPEMLKEAFSTALLPKEQQPTEEEASKKFETMLMDAMGKTDVELVTTEVEVELAKAEGASWTLSATDDFIDAIMGGMMSAAKSMSDIGGEETEATPEDTISEIRNWLVGDIWNVGICDISHYLEDGKSSTGETMDVAFSVSGLDEAMNKKQEYDLFIKELPYTYKNIVDTWAKVSEQVDLLYGEIKASDLAPNGKGLDTGLYSQYFDAFDKAVSDLK